MKILITGGQGFFASRFVDFYKNKYEIFAPGHKELDVTDEASVNKVIAAFAPDIIIHTAAVASTDYCNGHPDIAHKINVDGTVYLAHAAKEIDAQMVFISSEQVFNGNDEAGPYSENHMAVPDTVYGQTKLEAEKLLQEILPELWILRFTWLFGLPQRNCGMSDNIVWGTIKSILQNKPVKASKNEFRGMTYVQEVIENMEKIFKIPYGTYNIGAQNNKSRYEITAEIIKELGLEQRLPELLSEDTIKYAQKARDIRINTDKAARAGVIFSDTTAAIKKCLAEYKFYI